MESCGLVSDLCRRFLTISIRIIKEITKTRTVMINRVVRVPIWAWPLVTTILGLLVVTVGIRTEVEVIRIPFELMVAIVCVAVVLVVSGSKFEDIMIAVGEME